MKFVITSQTIDFLFVPARGEYKGYEEVVKWRNLQRQGLTDDVACRGPCSVSGLAVVT